MRSTTRYHINHLLNILWIWLLMKSMFVVIVASISVRFIRFVIRRRINRFSWDIFFLIFGSCLGMYKHVSMMTQPMIDLLLSPQSTDLPPMYGKGQTRHFKSSSITYMSTEVRLKAQFFVEFSNIMKFTSSISSIYCLDVSIKPHWIISFWFRQIQNRTNSIISPHFFPS